MAAGIPRVPEPWEWRKEKVCTKCKESKPWALYSPAKYWEDGTVRRVQAWCRECRSKAAKPRKITPERLAYCRDWKRKRRAELRQDRMITSRRQIMLPLEPWRDFLSAQLERFDTWADLAQEADANERSLRRAFYDEQQHVSLALADRVVTNLGFHINDVFPELADEEMAA